MDEAQRHGGGQLPHYAGGQHAQGVQQAIMGFPPNHPSGNHHHHHYGQQGLDAQYFPPQHASSQLHLSAAPQFPAMQQQQQQQQQPPPFGGPSSQHFAGGHQFPGGQQQPAASFGSAFHHSGQQFQMAPQQSMAGSQFPPQQQFTWAHQNQQPQQFTADGHQFVAGNAPQQYPNAIQAQGIQQYPGGAQQQPQQFSFGQQTQNVPQFNNAAFAGQQQYTNAQQLQSAEQQQYAQQLQDAQLLQTLQVYGQPFSSTQQYDGAHQYSQDGGQQMYQYGGAEEAAQNGNGNGEPMPMDVDRAAHYEHIKNEVEGWVQSNNVPISDEDKAEFIDFRVKLDERTASRRPLAELGEADFDEQDIDEAVRATKRRRMGSLSRDEALSNAHKVFEFGPHNNPEMDVEQEEESETLDGLALDAEILGLSAEFKGENSGAVLSLASADSSNNKKDKTDPSPLRPNFHMLESICSSVWLMVEVTKHLRVRDIVNLYSVSRTFHALVDAHFQSTIIAWAEHMSPAGIRVFYWKYYGKYTMRDPAGTTWANPGPVALPRPPWATADNYRRGPTGAAVRRVPSLRYLAMVEQRETRARDILACLARAGHRTPRGTHKTLLKIWMLMDAATNSLRRGIVHNAQLWTDRDLYNAQAFVVKLHMRLNEPVFGPASPVLGETLLGSRAGLTPLWQLLRRKGPLTDPVECIRQRIRYWVPRDVEDHYALLGTVGVRLYFGVHPSELGAEHREGWGRGHVHLSRPDELVVEEAVRRGVDLAQHLPFMVFWGHVDLRRGRNLVPTEDEMYMSDDELPPLSARARALPLGGGRCGNVPFDYDDWQPKHAMKARWRTLSRAEKRAVIADDEREQLLALPFEDADDAFWDPYNANDEPDADAVEERRRAAKAERARRGRELSDRWEAWSDASEWDVSDEPFFDESDQDPVLGMVIDDPLFPESDGEQEEDDGRHDDDDDDDDDDAAALALQEECGALRSTLPDVLVMPASVTDPATIANWGDMDPYLQKAVIEGERRRLLQDKKDERTATQLARREQAAARAPQAQQQQQQHNYQYPGVTDPQLLALLRRYDEFPPEAFEPAPESDSQEEEEEEQGAGEDEDDVGDDDALKALADMEYTEEELDFDISAYQRFLDRVADLDAEERRRKRERERGEDADEVVDETEDGDDEDDMAHEADLDDDIPFPKYEFRKY